MLHWISEGERKYAHTALRMTALPIAWPNNNNKRLWKPRLSNACCCCQKKTNFLTLGMNNMVSTSCGTSSLSCRCHTTEALVRESSLGVDPMLKGVQIRGTNKTGTLQNMASKNGCQELLCLVLGKNKK